MQSFNTPILLLIFNRPDSTKEVLERIRIVKPMRLYIAADGPRESKPKDLELCRKTRDLTKLIDWECEVKYLFRETNLGCGNAISSAITWFFKQEEQGIILEDDCLPSISFFCFCERVLNYYKYDTRIWHITGYNTQDGIKRGDGDYYFSQETPIWGWASWRRVWKHFNFELTTFNRLNNSYLKYNIKRSRLQSITAMFDFSLVNSGTRRDIWSFNYAYYQLINSGLTIIPNNNLIQNIGFREDATHTTKKNKKLEENIAHEIDFSNIKHPSFMLPDIEADAYTFNSRTRVLKKVYVFGMNILKRIFS